MSVLLNDDSFCPKVLAGFTSVGRIDHATTADERVRLRVTVSDCPVGCA